MSNNRYTMYDLKSAESMLDLAEVIQSYVYWGKTFYDGDTDKEIKASEFWDVCRDYINKGCNRVKIYAYHMEFYIDDRD